MEIISSSHLSDFLTLKWVFLIVELPIPGVSSPNYSIPVPYIMRTKQCLSQKVMNPFS